MSDPATVSEMIANPDFWRAALSLSVLGASTALLGCVLVVRRLALLGDVLAHAMLPGVGVAWLLMGVSVPALLCGGLIAGLVTAIGSGLISRFTRVKEDAAFAAMFATMFAAGLVLADLGGGSEALLHLLVGDIRGIARVDATLAITVAGVTMLAFAIWYRAILLECFDPVFHRASGGYGHLIHLGLLALVVLNLVASLRTLGAVLAVGMFMLPAVTASLWSRRWITMLGLSAMISVVGALVGLVIGWRIGAAAGPMIVAVLGGAFVLSMLLSPIHGVIGRSRAVKHHREESDDWCESPRTPPEVP